MKSDLIWWIATGVLFGLLASHLMWGSTAISLVEALTGRNETGQLILREVRLPRVLTAMAAGAGLSVSGLLLQTWFGNPLAGPSVLGVSSGAGMGVALAVLLPMGVGWLTITASAIIGSALVLVAVALVANRFQQTAALLVFGLMLNYVIGALITVLQAESAADSLQHFIFWGMGTFGQVPLKVACGLLCMVLVGLGWAWRLNTSLDTWTLGDYTAQSMGLERNRFRWSILAIAGVITGGITATCGPVAFLGLATPHVVRMFAKGRSHRFLIPMTALTGAIIALLADWGVKGGYGMDTGWPLNAVLSLIGGPMVVWVLVKKGMSAS